MQAPTMKLLGSIAGGFLLASSGVPSALAAEYRLQSTPYAVTVDTSFALKNENCHSSFGKESFLLDMKAVQSDFASEEEFNEALTGVFFKEPNAAFFVAYAGKDAPADPPTPEDHYAVRMSPEPIGRAGIGAVDSFGRATVDVWNLQAQVLCGVPVKEYQPPKAYTSKEDADEAAYKNASSKSFGLRRLVVPLTLLAIALLVRKHMIGHGMGPAPATASDYNTNPRPRRNKTRSLLTDAYYSVLDQKAGGNNPFDDPIAGQDLSVGLTEGCELSYNPAQQGLV